ncbi:MAG: TolB protein [Verrucomicrobiota bacterium]|jgi:TolB protein|nr:TolB protein [Verrucomicrobiota bacterium]
MKKVMIFLFCAVYTALCAEAQIRVVKSADRKISIDFSAARASRDADSPLFFQTLERDLQRSGWFKPVRGTGELRLIGTAGRDGGNVKAVCQIYRRSDQARLFSKSYNIESGRARTLAHHVADDMIKAITGNKGFASARIALVGNLSGAKELYICDADGGGLTQITRDGRIIIGPNWSPDGNRLVYTSFLRGFPDVYLADLRRGRRELIAGYGGLNTGATFSPNGRDVALILSKDGNPELYIKNLSSGTLTRLTMTRAAEASPTWSPDGQNLVYVSDQSGTPQLYIISRSGGRPRRLSSRGTENVAPDWGPNGLIACASRSGGRYVIAVINPSTGQTTYLQTDNADYEDPSWAPDGRHIVAARTVGYQSSIYLLDTVSDAPVALLQGSGSWYFPAFSPQ